MLILPRITNYKADSDSEDRQRHGGRGVVQPNEGQTGKDDSADSCEPEGVAGTQPRRDVPMEGTSVAEREQYCLEPTT